MTLPFYIRRRACLLLIVMIMGLCMTAEKTAAQASAEAPTSPPPQPTSVPRLPVALAADITFDSAVWEQAAVFTGFALAESVKDSRGVLQSTIVKMFHDGENLYVLYNAMDTSIDRLAAEPVDEFSDTFPQGDHGELQLSYGYAFAFGPQGNRYDAYRYDRAYDSAFKVKSRINNAKDGDDQTRQPTGWQSMVVIPMRGIIREFGRRVPMHFVRHYDGGMDRPQRSYLAIVRTVFDLE